jgi:virulence-associated protein VagC
MAARRKSTKTAKLILRGGYQYVILPKEFQFKGKAVRIHKQGDAVVLEPVIVGVKKWLADLGRHPLSEDFTVGKRH